MLSQPNRILAEDRSGGSDITWGGSAEQISSVVGSCQTGFLLKLGFTRKCTYGPGRSLRSLTKAWSSKESLSQGGEEQGAAGSTSMDGSLQYAGASPTLVKESCPLLPGRNCRVCQCPAAESGMQAKSTAGRAAGWEARRPSQRRWGLGCLPFSAHLSLNINILYSQITKLLPGPWLMVRRTPISCPWVLTLKC